MTAIESYYDLLHKINISDFKFSLYTKNPDEIAELENEQKIGLALKNELDNLKNQLSKKSNDADTIRTALIHVANGVLNSFAQIKKWGIVLSRPKPGHGHTGLPV